jgi:hypothetical protein
MKVKYYGVLTKNGSWYLLEDHSHMIGDPTWFIHMGESCLQINLLAVENFRSLINTPEQYTASFRNGVLMSKKQIRRTEDFIGKMIMGSNESIEFQGNIDLFMKLQSVLAHTSPIVQIISFK